MRINLGEFAVPVVGAFACCFCMIFAGCSSTQLRPAPKADVTNLEASAEASRPLRRPAMARDAQRTKRSISDSDERGQTVAPEMLAAARDGDLDRLKALMKTSTAQINARDGITGESLLSVAVEYARVEIVRYALDQGANPLTKGPRGNSVLNMAIQRGHDRIALLLLNAGASPDQKNDSGNTALHDAAQFNRPMVVDALIKSGADVEARNRAGWPALVIAVREGHVDIAQKLVTAGANPNVRGKDSFTPLYWAVYKRNRQAADVLVKAGAQVGTMSLETLE